MGEVVSHRLHRLMKEDGVPKERAQRYLGHIDVKIAHMRPMGKRDRLRAAANGEACTMKRDSASQTINPNRKQVETESDMR